MKYEIKLRSVGNPDHGQYAPVSNPQTVRVDTLEQAALVCREYIAKWDLGGDNWPKTIVKENGKPVATVSYNGRIWAMDGHELCVS